ncbi:MAG: NAD(P)H-dependent oxidoreductase subunit E [Armatimonadetes bacterium]|nr:NAD(P)H-dependent oxidoreductase subunit E [Armatimonadota bacterium]
METVLELIRRFRDEPAPLLSVLHALHDRRGYLGEDDLREVARQLRIPLAELFGTVTFYHHFSRRPPGKAAPRVCTGPICALRGSEDLLARLGPEATPMPCAGRCDQPVPVLQGERQLVACDGLKWLPTPLPPGNPGGFEECVFTSIREPGRSSLRGYGGYRALEKAQEMGPGEVLRRLSKSGLTGRGGAGFPTGTKWRLVAEARRGPKAVVCNADEGEPGCFKDRTILEYDPHAVIEGMLLAAYATGATRAFLYLRYEYPETAVTLERALEESRKTGLPAELGVTLHLRRGAGAYICGEEGALLNSLEGRRPFPRSRPPYPVTHGFEDLPTVVNNVETLASVPRILCKGAAWYRGLGCGDLAGARIVSLSGDILRPGNYEVPLGLPLKTLLLEWAGGPAEGRSIQAVSMAGLSGGLLAGEDLDATLDDAALRARGSMLGAGGIMVFDDRRDMLEVARRAMAFFAHESCGKCSPCRVGTTRLLERLGGEAGPEELGPWLGEVEDLMRTMKELSACGLGMAAPVMVESLLRYFPDRARDHVRRKA